jgi:hypothetical protein
LCSANTQVWDPAVSVTFTPAWLLPLSTWTLTDRSPGPEPEQLPVTFGPVAFSLEQLTLSAQRPTDSNAKPTTRVPGEDRSDMFPSL